MRNMTQEQVDGTLETLAGAFVAKATSTATGWRQVPLMAVLANGRSGWLGAWSETASTRRHPFSSAGGAGLRVRCSDGVPLAWSGGEGDRVAETAYVLSTAASAGYDLGAWDGDLVLAQLARSARKPISAYYDPAETHQSWKDTISQHRVGLVANWEEETGPLHEVSETLVGLAATWDGCVGSLLRASVDAARASGARELHGLTALDESLELTFER